MQARYRKTDSLNEIVKILFNSNSHLHNFIWFYANNKRVVTPIKRIMVNEEHMYFQVEVEHTLPLQEGQLIYLKLATKDTVCKIQVMDNLIHTIKFSFPKTMHTVELRETVRIKFKPLDDKRITLNLPVEILPNALQEVPFQVIDICEKGVALLIKDKHLPFFERGKKIELVRMQDMLMSTHYELDVLYIKKFRYKLQGRIQTAYRVGTKSNIPFQKSQLQYLKLC